MSGNRTQQQLACLYTRHKTQKRKVWKDGRLVLNSKSYRAILHDADPPAGSGDPSLGDCEISSDQFRALLEEYTGMLETERYLIEVEGPWNHPVTTATAAANSSSSSSSSSRGRIPMISGKRNRTMQKLLASKFQKPRAYVPPPPWDPSNTSRVEQVLSKRKRPLQPGEWMAMHHGSGSSGSSSANGGVWNDRFGGRSQDRLPPQPHSQPQPHTHPQPQNSDNNRYRENHRPMAHAGGRNFHSGPPTQQQQQQQQQRPRPQPQPQPPFPAGYGKHPDDHRQDPYRTPEPEPSSFGTADSMPPRGGASQLTQQHQPQQQQQQHFGGHPRRRQHRSNDCHGFAQNEFDAARYYGIDEDQGGDGAEEEEEETPVAESFSATLPLSTAPPSFSQAPSHADIPRAGPEPQPQPQPQQQQQQQHHNADSNGRQNQNRDEFNGEKTDDRRNAVANGPTKRDLGSEQHRQSPRKERFNDRLLQQQQQQQQQYHQRQERQQHRQQQQQQQQQHVLTADPCHRDQPETHEANGRPTSLSPLKHLECSNGEKRIIGNRDTDDDIPPPVNSEKNPCTKRNGDGSEIMPNHQPQTKTKTKTKTNTKTSRKDDGDDEESDSDSDDDCSENDGFPSSFRLKPSEPSTNRGAKEDQNHGFAAMSSLSGNRLLALFGAENASQISSWDICDSDVDSDVEHSTSTSIGIGGNRNSNSNRYCDRNYNNQPNHPRGTNEPDCGKENFLPRQRQGGTPSETTTELVRGTAVGTTDGFGNEDEGCPKSKSMDKTACGGVGVGGSRAGFYLPPAATSSEESSDEEESD